MTRQQVLTTAAEAQRRPAYRKAGRAVLIRAAVAAGRTETAARKASTMRLSQWASGYRSAI